jgi:hypothetical protein
LASAPSTLTAVVQSTNKVHTKAAHLRCAVIRGSRTSPRVEQSAPQPCTQKS